MRSVLIQIAAFLNEFPHGISLYVFTVTVKANFTFMCDFVSVCPICIALDCEAGLPQTPVCVAHDE